MIAAKATHPGVVELRLHSFAIVGRPPWLVSTFDPSEETEFGPKRTMRKI